MIRDMALIASERYVARGADALDPDAVAEISSVVNG